MFRHRVLVAQDDELHSGSRHRHVHAAEVFQESDLSLIVGAYQGDEDHVSFLSLETIYRIHADQTAVRLEELIFLDEFLEILHLGTVRRNDAYIDSFLQNALFAYLGEVFRQGDTLVMKLGKKNIRNYKKKLQSLKTLKVSLEMEKL